MALTFPLSLAAFADRLPMQTAPFVLEEMMELSGLGSGDVIGAQLAPSRWTTSVRLAPMDFITARGIQTRIESLNGPVHSFYLYSPTNCYPAGDPGGVILASSVVTIDTVGANNKSLRFTGLPAGYVLTEGDAFGFDYGTNPVRRAYHHIAETVTASGTGLSPLFEITPPLRPGAAVGLPVILKKPSAKMFRMPGPLDVNHTMTHSVITFDAMQRP